jgi:hypothetical protein
LVFRVRWLFEFGNPWWLLIPLHNLFLHYKRIILPLNRVTRGEHSGRLDGLRTAVCIVDGRQIRLRPLVICVIHIIIAVLLLFGMNYLGSKGRGLSSDIASWEAALALILALVELNHGTLLVLSRRHGSSRGTVLHWRL